MGISGVFFGAMFAAPGLNFVNARDDGKNQRKTPAQTSILSPTRR